MSAALRGRQERYDAELAKQVRVHVLEVYIFLYSFPCFLIRRVLQARGFHKHRDWFEKNRATVSAALRSRQGRYAAELAKQVRVHLLCISICV